DFLSSAQRCIAIHEGDTAGVGADVDRSEVGVGGDHLHAGEQAAQRFRGHLRDHRVGPLADIGRAGVDDDTAVAVNFDVHRGVRHVGTDDRVGRAAYVVAASNAEAPASSQLSFALVPA